MTTEAPALKASPVWMTGAVNGGLRLILRGLCRLHLEQLEKIPMQGPLIIAVNHVNFIDSPIAFSHMYPRPVTALVKSETWKNPLLGALFTLWGCIPIQRGEADASAIQSALQALQQGKLLAIAPEGTRSGNGCLRKGYPGLALLAVRSGVPVLPVAFHGIENIWQNLKHFKRTECYLEVGTPFTVVSNGQAFSRDVRQQITDEIMYQIAALLPERYRGVYADSAQASSQYLRF